MASFAASLADLMRGAQERKAGNLVAQWVLSKCREAREAGDIQVNREMIRYDEAGKEAAAYVPCEGRPRF